MKYLPILTFWLGAKRSMLYGPETDRSESYRATLEVPFPYHPKFAPFMVAIVLLPDLSLA